jgi:outer membrane protein assembly complex protein YaeT
LSVSAGKPTRFEWSGDDPGKDLRQSIERAWDGRIPEPFLRDDLAQSVRTRLAAKRYYLARVETRVEEEDKARQVVFDVTRGPRGRRVELRFEGNESMGEAALREALPPADSAAFFVLLERPAELERGIRLRYASEGFLSVSLGEIQQAYDAEAGSLGVTIPIQEGPRTRVAELTFEGSTAFEPERLGRALGVAVGDPVDLAAIRRGEATLRTLYREEGFPDVRLRSALGRVEEGVAVQVGIEEGHRARVGDIRIVGNVRSRESVIRHELTFERGAPLRSTDLQESQKRLYDLGVFRTADVRTDPTQAGETVQDVIIQIIERPDLDVNYGLRYNAFSSQQSIDEEAGSQRKGLEVLSQINVVNPLGLGSNVGFSIFLRGDYQLYRGTLRIPTPLGKRITTEITLDTDRDQDRLDIPGFDLRRDRLAFQQTKKLTDDRYDKLALQWNVSYARYRGQTVEAASGEIVTLEASRPRLGIAFIEDRRDSFANPTRGRFWNVSLQYSPKIWGSNVSFYRLFGQLFYYVPLGRKLVWASGVRLGFAPGERPFQLIDDRFQAGGPNSVRGFRQNALGPSVTVPETGKEIFIGGQAVAVLNQELRFPLYKALHGGVFWDAGNVFARLSDFRIPDLRQSVGAGLRYVLSFGAVRLDWARVLDPREGESSSRLHFSFGYAF